MLPRFAAVLVLACACVVGAEADAPVAAAPPARATAQDLLTTGKEALARYNSDTTMHAGAIVDAAIAFELAHRATADGSYSALVSDIQANLFWCRKQMDAVSMGQYRARLDSLPAARMAAVPSKPDHAQASKTLAAVTAVAPPAAPPAAPSPIVQPADTRVVDIWVQRLQDRIRTDIAAKREPHFSLPRKKSPAIIRDLAVDGTLTLALDGGEMSYPWKLLTPQDLAAIAASLPANEDYAGHALAAFFHLAAGDVQSGRASLQRAGTLADEVERAFQVTASR